MIPTSHVDDHREIIRFEKAHSVDLYVGDCRTILPTLPAGTFQSCVTSPPYYGLRNYGVHGQIGLEQTPDEYVRQLVDVFRAVRRLLRGDATLWLNLGDSYANDGKWGGASSGKHSAALHGNTGIGRGRKHTGAKPKDLLGMPWRVAAYEMIFLLTKAQNYYYDADAIAEPTVCDRIRGPALHPDVLSTNGNGGLARRPIAATRNCRNVWTINTKPCKEAHFAVMAPEVARRCVLAGCPAGGAIIDPFGGAGTTGLVAAELGRGATLIELNPDYVDITCQRLGHLINRRF